MEIVATSFLAIAILHTFLVSRFQRFASKYPEGSFWEKLFHLLGEVEVVFGFWAGIFMVVFATALGKEKATQYLEGLSFKEPLFVFAIMTVCATRPILYVAKYLILVCSRMIPLRKEAAFYFTALSIGPLLGSFITEPAAMTVVAFLLRERYFEQNVSLRFKYTTLATLFVNVSIGGILTSFAAPPVLMVAHTWGWGTHFMLETFGWKAIFATSINA